MPQYFRPIGNAGRPVAGPQAQERPDEGTNIPGSGINTAKGFQRYETTALQRAARRNEVTRQNIRQKGR